MFFFVFSNKLTGFTAIKAVVKKRWILLNFKLVQTNFSVLLIFWTMTGPVKPLFVIAAVFFTQTRHVVFRGFNRGTLLGRPSRETTGRLSAGKMGLETMLASARICARQTR